ncbi:MAG: helix-turn-helix domain-containing protein [Acidobacteria bacterium]|nr:MAG: helix-turn-helix domain-containing protein [Acidobacteriota bacterium]
MKSFPRVLLLVESSRSSGRELLRGIAEYARLHGPWSFHWEPRGLETGVPSFRDWRPDGVIMRDYDPVGGSIPPGIPAVSVGHCRDQVPGVVSIVSASEAIADRAANHLLDCGLRRFAYCGYDDKPWSLRRQRRFVNRLRSDGYPVAEYTVDGDPASLTWDEELPQLVEWVRTLSKPVGLMACNDDRARQVSEACKVVGVRVPDDVAIIGADNDQLVCEFSDPPLSSVELDFHRAGFEAAGVLHLMMLGQTVEKLTISVEPSRVVPRRSTEILAVDDRAVGKALSYIRENPRRRIRVDEVARAAALSRRVLEKRFRACLGRSVMHEIRRVRTDHIARLLIETDLSIQQIGSEMGFSGIEHIARYFREEKGSSPLAYRRKHGQRLAVRS